MTDDKTPAPQPTPSAAPQDITPEDAPPAEGVLDAPVEEIGGPKGAEPTRFGDWERNGRCSDF